MSSENGAPGFNGGERHGWIAEFCELLERRIAGRFAGALLAAKPGRLPRSGAVFVLPAWQWAEPGIDVGAKSRARNGGTLLLPVRMHWMPAPLLVVGRDASLTAQWSGSGLGHSARGSTALIAGDEHHIVHGTDELAEVPQRITAPVLSRPKLMAELRRIVADGRDAEWALIGKLEPFVNRAVDRAHGRVSVEIAGDTQFARPLLEPTDLEIISDRLLLGDANDPDRDSRVAKIVDKCVLPTTFTKVDPLRYITVALNRDAEAEIRRVVGDAHVGPKIRRLARQMNHAASVEEIVAACRDKWPADRIAHDRVETALAVARHPLAPTLTDELPPSVLASHEDAAIARIDAARARAKRRALHPTPA